MPRLMPIRTLDLRRAPANGRARHVAAASGLARVQGHLYVVADDEHHLGVFDAEGSRPGELLRVVGGTLPDAQKARKRAKPDFESLVMLPAFRHHPFGALFVLGSGSRPNRREAVLIPLGSRGEVHGRHRTFDLAPWFSALAKRFRGVNIEGAFVDGPYLALLQRGNRGDARNARIRIPLAPALEAMARGARLPRASDPEVSLFKLGAIDGVPLCFTDGAALPGGGFVFTAVAEDTEDGVADGACAGSALGLCGADGRVYALWRLDPPLKVEGVCVDGPLRWLVCTDADDAKRPARLLRLTLHPEDLRVLYRREGLASVRVRRR